MHIFDAHVHIFPDKIAAKASKNIGKFYDLEMRFDGSVKSLLQLAEKYSIDKCLVQSVATTPKQTKHINDFISESVKQNPDLFVGFCSIHPLLTKQEIQEEIDRIIKLGLKGIKLHPDFQQFNIDSREVYSIYEAAEGRLPILFHTGDVRYSWSAPQRLANVLKDFKNLTAIASHFGGWSQWDDGMKYLAEFENCYVDTSSSLYAVSPQKARQYIDAFGADRVLFGTDYPMWNIGDELKYMEKIDLTNEEREKIMYKNACRLLNTEI